MPKKTVYIVLAVEVDASLGHEEIDDVLNEAEFSVQGDGVTYKEIVETQFPYPN